MARQLRGVTSASVDNRTGDHPRELLTDCGWLLQWGEEAGVITAKTAKRLRHLAVILWALRNRDTVGCTGRDIAADVEVT